MYPRQFLLAGFVFVIGANAPLSAAYLAQSGFNDAVGINSNPTPNSPYTLGGALPDAGIGEAGWSGGWIQSGVVTTSNVYEGDGAAQIIPTASAIRQLSVPLTDRYSFEQYVRFDAGARLVVYMDQKTPQGEYYQGPIWQAFPDNKFNVVDGGADGAVNAPTEFTGFTWEPGVWYKISVRGDMTTGTWTFAVNDVPYISPDPLGYRGVPTYLDEIRFQSEGTGSVYLDALTVVPETSSTLLAGIAAIGFAISLTTKRVAPKFWNRGSLTL